MTTGKNKEEYEYRIVKLKNGLNEVAYKPQYRQVRKLTLMERIRGFEMSWLTVSELPCFEPQIMGDKEKLENAIQRIERHKADNIWISEIINI